MNGEPESANGSRRRISNPESVRGPAGLPAEAAYSAEAAAKAGSAQAGAQDVTQLLADWSHGDQAALQKLTPLVYEELRHLARRYMEGEHPGHTLQTTALVNEAYLRLLDQSKPSFTNRSHFLAVAAMAMRQILVDHARTAQRQRRGAGASKVELNEAALISPEQSGAILDLNDALERLENLDSRAAQGVELRYFGGLKQDEIAEVLKISTVTVRRDWVFSKAWLYKELHGAA
ncbi:MAG: RNA polymerase subunit sigma-70 [Acidobacteria bacterium]|nr:MAG: RNA polymerase subunit sigma-70 [Acidobacteriota bacterium]